MNKVSIVIPNYNGSELLRKNLPSVIKSMGYSSNLIGEIILVDDFSTDNSEEIARSTFPQVKLIKHKQNRGFSSAVNTGVRMAKGELVCLLNTDVSVSENFLEYVVGNFSDKRIFGVSLHEVGYGWSKGVFHGGFIVHAPGNEDNRKHDSFWVSGGSGVFRRKTWIELGGMEEVLYSPFYWEDIDLSYRALKRGFRIIWEARSSVIHHHESTISKLKVNVSRIQERNQLLFIWKNLTSDNLFKKHLIGLFERIVKNPGYIVIVFMALKKLSLVRKLRNIERREATVSDETIFASFKQ